MRAVEANDVARVETVIQEARAANLCDEKFFAIGLTRACDKNFANVARFLLSLGAHPDYVSGNKQAGLLRSAEAGLTEIGEILIDYHADLETRDKKGRTALMTAAWKNHFAMVKLLLTRGANIHTVDLRRRNVLHNLAADKGHQKSSGKTGERSKHRAGLEIVDYLLQAGINLDARDELGRTALHWTCVTDNETLMKRLLTSRLSGGSPSAELNATDGRMKTPLHLAASNDRDHLAAILLQNGADVHARSDGGWTALHNACMHGSLSLIEVLIEARADVNCELLNGRTPLHVAAETGNMAAARRLLRHPDVKRAVRDRFGNTPLLIAAQHGKTEIAEMLAPWNHIDLMTQVEIDASKLFNATIVDFGNFHNENKVTRPSVYDLLYARDRNDSTKHSVSTLSKNVKAARFRWIHLPANNIAWCDALLTKRFIEEGASDMEGYKALESCFSHQHRGQKLHSRFMRPMCQVVQRTPADMEGSQLKEDPEPPQVVVQTPTQGQTTEKDPSATPEKSGSKSSESKQNEPISTPGTQSKGSTDSKQTPKKKGSGVQGPAKNPKKDFSRKAGLQSKNSTDKFATSAPRKIGSSSCNIYMFIPYLHFETDRRQKEMQSAIEDPSNLSLRATPTKDEVLIQAYLTASRSFLHVRRTLDQFFYHNIDTRERDRDQVVYRYQKNNPKEPEHDPKIFMVDQLWMWILGKDLVVTSFPQRWRQPRNDPLNVLEGIIEDINSRTREPVQNVYELAMTIVGRCVGTFDRHRKGDDDYQFFDMFESSIGSAMDHEATLFWEFSQASRQASAWLRQSQRLNRMSKDPAVIESDEALAVEDRHLREELGDRHIPLFVDKLLDVGAETDLLAEIKDIRDELDLIRMVLDHQDHLLPELREAIKAIYRDERPARPQRKVDKVFDEQEKTIVNPLKDIKRMDNQAERIYTSIRDLLDLKQKHANAFEARFARDQAAGTVRQGRTIMVRRRTPPKFVSDPHSKLIDKFRSSPSSPSSSSLSHSFFPSSRSTSSTSPANRTVIPPYPSPSCPATPSASASPSPSPASSSRSPSTN